MLTRLCGSFCTVGRTVVLRVFALASYHWYSEPWVQTCGRRFFFCFLQGLGKGFEFNAAGAMGRYLLRAWGFGAITFGALQGHPYGRADYGVVS